MRWLALCLLISPAFAQDKPYDAKTWIAKLGDPAQAERAITELEQLGDPSAIEPIAGAWEAAGKPARYLKVIIELARPLTPTEAKAGFFVDYEQTGRPASWAKALPVLAKAATTFEVGKPREVDSAQAAVEGLGEANLPASVPPLAKVVARPPDKHAVVVAIAAIRALGKLTVARKEAAAALRPVLAVGAGQDTMKLAMVGAAINASADLRDGSLTDLLVASMFKNPPLLVQSRRALVAMPGTRAADALRPALRTKGDGGRVFYAALVLGDLHDAKAVPDLIAVLGRPALPAYIIDGQPSPNTTHDAAYDTLRKLGAKAAAKPLAAIWRDAKQPPEERAKAIEVYPYVADDAGDELVAIAMDNGADDQVRREAAIAAALLVGKRDAVKAYDTLAQRYYDEAAKRQSTASSTSRDAVAGELELKVAKQQLDLAKIMAIKVAHDPKASVAEIKAATENVRVATDAVKVAKQHRNELAAPQREAEATAKGYTGFGRMFQAQIGAIDVAIRCGNDARCYAATLSRPLSQLLADVAGDLVDVNAWSADDKQQLRAATLSRAILELVRRGGPAEAILTVIGDDDRLVRQSAMAALPHLAPRPCPVCVAKLSDAMKAGEGHVSLGDVNQEASILRNYF